MQQTVLIYSLYLVYFMASVAQSDKHLTGDREAVGLTPIGSVSILSWRS